MTTANTMPNNVSIVPKGRLAFWVLITGEIAIFGGLIATYILLRLRYPEWAEQTALTSTPLGALNTFVLLSSSYTIVLAHSYAAKKDFQKAFYLMLFTVFCGFIFLGVKTIEYSHEISLRLTLTSPGLVASGKGIGSSGHFTIL
ncbi:MAG: cytochrome c oxidase subunit 3 [Leptospiraceae bacterium]|nr:cytochrome c oxidase subunit 3 [Leptospiraceae bacterium]